MSVIVGICTQDHCTLFADCRRTRIDGDKREIDDTAKKLFRINDKVVFGVTGYIPDWETLSSPIDHQIGDPSINADTALQAVISYLKKNTDKLLETSNGRTYVIGGINRNGELCIYSVNVSVEDN